MFITSITVNSTLPHDETKISLPYKVSLYDYRSKSYAITYTINIIDDPTEVTQIKYPSEFHDTNRMQYYEHFVPALQFDVLYYNKYKQCDLDKVYVKNEGIINPISTAIAINGIIMDYNIINRLYDNTQFRNRTLADILTSYTSDFISALLKKPDANSAKLFLNGYAFIIEPLEIKYNKGTLVLTQSILLEDDLISDLAMHRQMLVAEPNKKQLSLEVTV